jgi:putative addiction module component (TIGR02574 family)
MPFAIDSLPRPRDFELIAELWDSLQGLDLPLTRRQIPELDRRLETADLDADSGQTWPQLLETLLSENP